MSERVRTFEPVPASRRALHKPSQTVSAAQQASESNSRFPTGSLPLALQHATRLDLRPHARLSCCFRVCCCGLSSAVVAVLSFAGNGEGQGEGAGL